MTSISTTRPGIQNAMPARPATAASGGAPLAAVLDPVRLIKQHKWMLALAAVVGAVVGAGLFLLLRQYAPSYRSTVLYIAQPPQRAVGEGDALQVDREEFERFVATESRSMTLEPVLRAAVQNSDVRDRTEWIKSYVRDGAPVESEAYRALAKIVSARAITGTQFISLDVSAPRREDAQILATAVHDAYFTDLARRNTSVSAEQRTPLSAQVQTINQEITRLETRNRQLLIDQQIETSDNVNTDADVMALAQALDKLSESQRMLIQAKEMQDSLNKAATAEGGIQFTETQREEVERRDPLVLDLRSQLAQLEASQAAMVQEGKGDNHLDRRAIRARIDSTREQIEIARREALEKMFAADRDKADQAVRTNEAIVRDQQARITEISRARNLKAVALNEIRANNDRLGLLRLNLRETEQKLSDISMMEAMRTSDRIGRIRRVNAARIPENLSFPRWEIMIPLGVFGVVGLTFAFLVFRELMDQRVRGPSDIGLIPRLRLLGIVPDADEDPTQPENVELAFKDAPTGAVSEAFRQVRAPIAKRMAQQGYKTLLVMAGSPESGATSAVCNLALQAAATDQRVLVIDANFRRPGLHRVFKLGEGPGLGDILARKSTLEQAVQQTAHANLTLLSAGSAPTRAVPERLSTDAMAALLQEAAGKYDLVLIDTAPALVAGDGMAVANRADAVVIVVRALSEKRGFIAKLRDQLGDVHAELLGVIVNGVRGTAGGYLKKNIRAAHEYQTADAD